MAAAGGWRAETQRLDRALALVVVVFVALVSANNLLPYVGLRDESCQTMFSGLDTGPTRNNHRFMPQHALSDVGAYWGDVRGEVRPPPAADSREALLAAWLARPRRDRNTEAVRSAVGRLCRAGHAVSLDLTPRGAARVHVADACAEPFYSRPHAWIPVRLFEPDLPSPEPSPAVAAP